MELSDLIPEVSPNSDLRFELLLGDPVRLLVFIPGDFGNSMCKIVAHGVSESRVLVEEAKIWRPIVSAIQCCSWLDRAHEIYGEKLSKFPSCGFDGASGVNYEAWRIWGMNGSVIPGVK